jgi:choline dehydrogenase-like flavoprotein
MVFIRGHAIDYEGWQKAGCPGWGYSDCAAILQTHGNLQQVEGIPYRGDKGPLRVYRADPKDPITQAFIKAGEEAGYPTTTISADIVRKDLASPTAPYTMASDGAPRARILTRCGNDQT